jgi:hypothetical protein
LNVLPENHSSSQHALKDLNPDVGVTVGVLVFVGVGVGLSP